MTTPQQPFHGRPARACAQRLSQHLSPATPIRHARRSVGRRSRAALADLRFTGSPPKTGAAQASAGQPSAVTNIGVMPPGGQVNPGGSVGRHGRTQARPVRERTRRARTAQQERQAFEAKTMQRFADLEQRLTSAQQAAATPAAPTPSHRPRRPPCRRQPRPAPPPSKGSPARRDASGTGDAFLDAAGGAAARDHAASPSRTVLHRHRRRPVANTGVNADPASGSASQAVARTVSTFLPVSLPAARAVGGLDAPTGGQSQSIPPGADPPFRTTRSCPTAFAPNTASAS